MGRYHSHLAGQQFLHQAFFLLLEKVAFLGQQLDFAVTGRKGRCNAILFFDKGDRYPYLAEMMKLEIQGVVNQSLRISVEKMDAG